MNPDLLAGIEQAARRVGARRLGEQALAPRSVARGIRAVSRLYTVERDPAGGIGHGALPAAARLLFFTLADMPKLVVALAELHGLGRLPGGPLRILDLGAGFGTQTLGLLATLDRPLDIDVVDRDADALQTLLALAAECRETLGLGPRARILPTVHDVRGGAPASGPYDLVIAGNLLNELPPAKQRPLVQELLERLRPGGHLIVIEPALRPTARRLHLLRDELLAQNACSVVGPCTRQGPCPALLSPDDWCHERRPWTAPPGVRALARAAGLRRSDLRWSYLTLCAGTPVDHHGAWRVVSDPLSSKGKLELFLCGEAGRLRAVRLNRHRSDANRPLQQLRRGNLAWLEGAAERSGVLQVTAETGVTRRDPTDGGLA